MTRQRPQSPRVLTPLYAVLGATELAVEKLADLGATATGHRTDDRPESRVAQAGRVITGARQVPALAINQAIDTVVRTQEHYAGLAERGQRLAGRQTPVQQTGDLLRQAGRRVARGRDAASDAAQRTRSAASETVQTARGGAEDVVEAVSHPTRLGSVARPPRLVRPAQRARSTAPGASGGPGSSAEVTATAGDSARPKPRRPRVNAAAGRSATGQSRVEEDSRSRSGVPAGSGVEAGATMPTKRASGKTASRKSGNAKASAGPTTGPSSSPGSSSPSTAGAVRPRPRRVAPVRTGSTSSTSSSSASSVGDAAADATATPARKKPAAKKAATSATSATSPAEPTSPADAPASPGAPTTEQA